MAQIKKLASKQHHYFTLNVNEVVDSVNVNNNTSDVSYSFVLSPKVKGYDWSIGNQITYTITINGSTVYTGHIPSYNGTSTVTLKSGTVTIPHNNDGTKTIDIAFNVTDSTSYSFTCGNASGSDTLSLTTIPRASQITVGDANIGSSTNITINKNSTSFTTTLYYKASGQSSYTKIVDKTSNQVYGWTVSTSFYALIPNSKTITCQFYAETYNGSTLVGTSNVVTATFTATGSPIINSCTLRSTDSTTINLVGNTRMIRYISTVTATVSASGQNSATISSIKVNGVTATNNVATFTKATTNSFEVVVTDSRGYSTTNTYTMTWTNYVPLTLNATISRNEPTDEKVNISFSGNYFNGNFTGSSSIANTLTVQYRSREAGGTWGSWTTISHTKSGNTYSGSTQLSNYDYTKQYEFQMQAIDRVSTIPQNGIIVSKGQPIYWWNDSSFNVTENINAKKKIIIPKDSTYGIADNSGNTLLSSYANNNVVFNASGGTLFLGYRNTTGISFLNGKGLLNSDGNMSIAGTLNNIYLGTWSDNTSSYLANFKTFILSSNCRVGTSILTLGFNGQHLTGIIEKASTSYASAYLLSYSYRKHLRYLAGTWYDNDYAYTSELTQNVLSVRPSANVGITATGFQKLTLNTQIFKNGSNLSIANGGILIGSGITKVFVSGSIYFYANTQAGDSLRVAIYKNSDLVVENFARAGTNGTYEHRVITPYPITVAQGDYIYLYYSNASSARGSVASSATDTYLLVQEIK